jgi:hypothetical protein
MHPVGILWRHPAIEIPPRRPQPAQTRKGQNIYSAKRTPEVIENTRPPKIATRPPRTPATPTQKQQNIATAKRTPEVPENKAPSPATIPTIPNPAPLVLSCNSSGRGARAISNPACGSARYGAQGERGNLAEIGAPDSRGVPVGGKDQNLPTVIRPGVWDRVERYRES